MLERLLIFLQTLLTRNQLPTLKAAITQFDLTLDVADLEDIQVILSAGAVNMQSKQFKILENARIETELTLGPDRIRKSPYRVSTSLATASGVISGKIKTNRRTSVLKRLMPKQSIVARGDLEILGQILDIKDTLGAAEADGKLTLSIPIQDEGDAKFLITADARTKDGRIDGFRLRDSKAKLEIDKDQMKLLDGVLSLNDKTYGDLVVRLSLTRGWN